MLTLPRDWDMNGAGPIPPATVEQAFGLAFQLMDPDSPAPWVVPMSSGGIQLERHRSGADLEIEIDSNGTADGSWFEPEANEEVELKLPRDANRIRSYIAQIK